jgi:hypothetical protein
MVGLGPITTSFDLPDLAAANKLVDGRAKRDHDGVNESIGPDALPLQAPLHLPSHPR